MKQPQEHNQPTPSNSPFMTSTKFRWRIVAEDPLAIITHPQTLAALSADTRRKLFFLPANSSHLRNTPLHPKIRSGEWQHPSVAAFQKRAARMGCNPHAAALPDLSNRHSASPARSAGSRQRIFVTIPKANPIIFAPFPKQIPLSLSPSLRQTPFPAPHVRAHPPPPDSPSTHPRWGDAPRPRFPGRGVTGGTDTLRSEPAVTPGGGSSTAPPGPPPRGSAVRAACFQLPAKSPLPPKLEERRPKEPRTRRGSPTSCSSRSACPQPGGAPAARSVRPSALRPPSLPCGRGRREEEKEGGREQPRTTPRPRCAAREEACSAPRGRRSPAVPPPLNIHTHIRAPTRQEEAFRRRWAFPEGSRRKFRPSRANGVG